MLIYSLKYMFFLKCTDMHSYSLLTGFAIDFFWGGFDVIRMMVDVSKQHSLQRLYFEIRLHPRKLTCPLKKGFFNRDMLVFQGLISS